MKRRFMYRICCIALLILVCSNHSQAQRSVLIEAGATYFTNDIPYPATNLSDFLALTITPRFILTGKEHSALSLDLPLSIRSRFNNEVLTRFGTHLPALISYNIGAGATSTSSPRKLGAMVGVGMGYFFQQSKAKNEETPQYNESLSVFGPVAAFGVRFRMSKKVLFRTSDKDAHPYLAIKFIYQADWNNRQNDIGALSAGMGIRF